MTVCYDGVLWLCVRGCRQAGDVRLSLSGGLMCNTRVVCMVQVRGPYGRGGGSLEADPNDGPEDVGKAGETHHVRDKVALEAGGDRAIGGDRRGGQWWWWWWW